MDAVLYADDDEDDDADFRFTVMVEEAEIVAELAGRIFGASHPLAKDAQKVLGRGHLQGNYQKPLWQCLSKLITLAVQVWLRVARPTDDHSIDLRQVEQDVFYLGAKPSLGI